MNARKEKKTMDRNKLASIMQNLAEARRLLREAISAVDHGKDVNAKFQRAEDRASEAAMALMDFNQDFSPTGERTK
jgi:hypothetical protein